MWYVERGGLNQKNGEKNGENEADGQSVLQTELNKAKSKNNSSWDSPSQSHLKSTVQRSKLSLAVPLSFSIIYDPFLC